jgi:hypothetical protein
VTSHLNGLMQTKAASSWASVRRVLVRLHDPAPENELTHDGSRMQRNCVQLARVLPVVRSSPVCACRKRRPTPLEIATRRSPRRIVINQRTWTAWGGFPEVLQPLAWSYETKPLRPSSLHLNRYYTLLLQQPDTVVVLNLQ